MRAFAILSSTLALAASAVAQYNITSQLFSLALLSTTNSTLNGTRLYACHEGAAIEGLCLGGTATTPSFQFNTSAYGGSSGYLIWTLVSGSLKLSSPMSLSYNPVSNVAVPLFTPAQSGTPVGFDAGNKLYISGYIDDTQVPVNNSAQTSYYRWWACQTNAGYLYNTLAWTLGNGVPQNPSCQKVDVLRVF